MKPTEDVGIMVSKFTGHSLIKPKSTSVYVSNNNAKNSSFS